MKIFVHFTSRSVSSQVAKGKPYEWFLTLPGHTSCPCNCSVESWGSWGWWTLWTGTAFPAIALKGDWLPKAFFGWNVFHTSQRKDIYLIYLLTYLWSENQGWFCLRVPSHHVTQLKEDSQKQPVSSLLCGVFCPFISLSPRSHASFLAWSCGAVLFSPALGVIG